MSRLKVNQRALEYAKKLIQQGKLNIERDSWEQAQPTPASEDQFLENHSYEEYGNWFLAVNEDENEDTKARYEFPIGNFNEIFRSGVIAAEARAGQYHHSDIEAAAKSLLDLIDDQ